MTALTAPVERRPAYGWLWVSAAVIALDFVTKLAITNAFHPGDEKVITPFFSLVLTFNPGAAFSFLAGAGGWQRWFFAAIAIGATAVIALLLKRGGDRWYCLGLALILGGALGNLWDRLVLGAVIDFLLFHWRSFAWPAFNVADSAITVGAALLILDGFLLRRARDDLLDRGRA
jgi:signal peptidase II